MRHCIAIVDDEAADALAVSRILGESAYKTKSFQCADQFLSALRASEQFACVLLDENMPKRSGLATFAEMRSLGVTTPAIMVTGVATVSLTIKALEAGFSFLLEKPFDDRDLVPRVRTCCERHCQQMVEKLKKQRALAMLATLSSRELQVLKLMAGGMLNKQIASEMGVGLRTVETYRNRVLHKISADSFADAVAFAIAVGLRE